jgi:serine protease Do
MKIEPTTPLPVIGFGTSSDLMIGESVIAVGNAYGYEHTVTAGRVSFKGRDVSLNKEMGYKGLIQTSAPINPGNSGGPLLNVFGELVGVNVAIRAGAQNIGFALPIDFVITRAADMIGPRRRAGLRHGLVAKDNVTRDETETTSKRFVSVGAVEPNSPAAVAGFRPGDTVVQIDGIPVVTTIDLERGLLGKAAGAKVPVKVRRTGESDTELSLQLDAVTQVANKVPATAAEQVWKRLGVKVVPVGAEAVAKANPQLHGGLVLTEVAPGGVAAGAGLIRGDILVGLHQWETLNADNITFVLNHKDLASFLPLKFYVARDGKLKDGWITSVP